VTSSRICQEEIELQQPDGSPRRPFESLYIHVPFCCGRKCDYCAFYSEIGSTVETRKSYFERLTAETKAHASQCVPLRSIFVGGGTPSALSEGELEQLGNIIHQNFTLQADCEFTFESNPESLTPAKFDRMQEMGANRISLGIQSFSPRLRALIGRNGSLEQLESLVHHFRNAGLSRLNFDLIFNIPGESLQEWHEDLQRAMELEPNHLSAYSLILEPDTPLGQRLEGDDEHFLQFWHLTDRVLKQYGLKRYEISNFAVPGYECRHNYDVWHGRTYLGLGPAAVSFDGYDRPANASSLDDWLRGREPEHDIIGKTLRQAEILAFGLRTVKGWNKNDYFSVAHAWPEEVNGEGLTELVKLKLLKISSGRIAPTARGLLYNDTILEKLLDL